MTDYDGNDPSIDSGAGRSLGDALVISFRVLRVLFALLLVAFLFSGVFTVDSDEVAVRTAFGRITGGGEGEELPGGSGPYFRWPRPVGEVLRIPTVDREIRIDDSFAFPTNNSGTNLAEAELGRGVEGVDYGQLLTGDRNIVYARYRVLYRVREGEAVAFLQNAGPGDLAQLAATEDPGGDLLFAQADRLVEAAVKEAVVADTASRDINSFRAGRSTTEEGDDADDTDNAVQLASQDAIQADAQALLDRLETGIEITSINRPETTVPPPVRGVFDDLNAALQQQSQIINQAQASRRSTLTAAAGDAAPALLLAIDAYDLADSTDDRELRRAADATIERILRGQPVAAPLQDLAAALEPDAPLRPRLLAEVERAPTATVGGSAFETVQTAEGNAVAIGRQARALVNRTQNLLGEYERDPGRVRARLLLTTVRDLLGRPDATVEFIPQSDPPRRPRPTRSRTPPRRRTPPSGHQPAAVAGRPITFRPLPVILSERSESKDLGTEGTSHTDSDPKVRDATLESCEP